MTAIAQLVVRKSLSDALSLSLRALMYLDCKRAAYQPFLVIPELPGRKSLGVEFTLHPVGDADERQLIVMFWAHYDAPEGSNVQVYTIQIARFLMAEVPDQAGGEGFILSSLPDTVPEAEPAMPTRLN